MIVKIRPAHTDDKTLIKQMLNEYLKELSEIIEEESEYRYFNDYWIEKDRYPFLISMDNQPAGFAFVRFNQNWEIAEFYIKPSNRRNQAGRRAVLSILQKFKGHWSISYSIKNQIAEKFWVSIIADIAGSMALERQKEGRNTIEFHS